MDLVKTSAYSSQLDPDVALPLWHKERLKSLRFILGIKILCLSGFQRYKFASPIWVSKNRKRIFSTLFPLLLKTHLESLDL